MVKCSLQLRYGLITYGRIVCLCCYTPAQGSAPYGYALRPRDEALPTGVRGEAVKAYYTPH